MKTLKILTTTLIVALSLSAFADGKKPNRKMKKEKRISTMVISAPAMIWGNPEDVNTASVEKLKTSPYLLFNAPEINWGSPEDLDLKSIEKLKNAPLVPAPAMVWGSPTDVYYFEIKK